MAFNYEGSFYSESSTTSSYISEHSADLLFDFEVPYWNQFNFEPLAPCTVDDGDTLVPPPPLQLTADFYSPPLSSPESSESPTAPHLSTLSTPNLPSVGSPSPQPPATTQPTTPPTPPTPWQPNSGQIPRFDFCPFTRLGQVCGHVSWACSANKQIKRHLKMEHFPETSLGYECPNPKCTYKDYRFLRKDACDEHRKVCNLLQALDYVPMPSIVTGNDAEVDRWMRARLRQRRAIVKKLRDGTPWSKDLLEPVDL